MAHSTGHSDRPPKFYPSKRVIGFIIACVILSLLRFKAGTEGLTRETFKSLLEQPGKPAASATSTLAGDEQSDVDAQLDNVTTVSTNPSSPAPFPKLAPPDNEEYMAICMVGEYLYTYPKSQSGKVLSAPCSEEPIHGSP